MHERIKLLPQIFQLLSVTTLFSPSQVSVTFSHVTTLDTPLHTFHTLFEFALLADRHPARGIIRNRGRLFDRKERV